MTESLSGRSVWAPKRRKGTVYGVLDVRMIRVEPGAITIATHVFVASTLQAMIKHTQAAFNPEVLHKPHKPPISLIMSRWPRGLWKWHRAINVSLS